ncbi:MAG: endopeptidase La [Candidatus Babeliaceae bacterium]|nr:endopeptidase La [Candidatus Babeliaceae bacterium]
MINQESGASERIKSNKKHLLPLLPLKNVVILPKSIIPIIVGRPSSIQAVEHALKHSKEIFISAQKDPSVENPTQDDVFAYGTRSIILQVVRMPKGALKILVEGLSRARMVDAEAQDGFYLAEFIDLPTPNLERTLEIEALWRHLHVLYVRYTQLNSKIPQDLMGNAKTIGDIDGIADTFTIHMNLTFDERQELLEIISLEDRLVRLAQLMNKEIDILETEERIRGRVQTQVEKNQREYYLSEQLKAIQKELGRDDQHTEIQQLRSKAKSLGLPEEPAEKIEKELKRLEQMPPMSSEAVVSRNYIDWVISLPWSKTSKDNISFEQAEKILNKSHAGLKKAKERIVEFLAAKKFSNSLERSPIICLVGPPGVGKTSLAESIAESLGREFVRISLGGVRDEAEIRGHRRTYIGALPGKILQAMRRAKFQNPVILLDEIDKMSQDTHGDPGAALLEVLDPEQNKNFVDHFLELEYDLSKVMFITTANHLEGIPYPLFDRMEIISLSGYTDDEKVSIAHDFLVPKNLKEYGLKKAQCKIDDDILKIIIGDYTKESGVRQLDRTIAKLMRKVIQQLLLNPKTKSVTITPALIKEWLGNVKYKRTNLEIGTPKIGLATGLAWTEMGGDVLEIEATVMPGKGSVNLTGQLGDVMQESAHAALSYIRSRAADLGLPASFNQSRDIHIHIPEGATPKDGPSAGITMCTALISALTKNPINPRVAMTGEITLRGRVLGVGGLKEKILAGHQHKISTILLPYENKDDVEEFIKDIPSDLKLIYVKTIDEVLKYAFTKNPFSRPMKHAKKKSKTTQSK